MFKKEKNIILTSSILFIAFVVFFSVLKLLSNLLIPLIIAILFSFVIIGVSNFYKKYVKLNVLSFFLSLITFSVIFWLIGKMIGTNIQDLTNLIPQYQEKIISLFYEGFTKFFGFLKVEPPTSVNQIINKIDLQYVFQSLVSGITSVFSSTGLILFYLLFILLEFRHFKEKLNLMFVDSLGNKELFYIIERIRIDIKSYFFIKTIVSFITASLSYIIMKTIGLDLAIFWSFLIFILNFIPSIGSMIAVSFPIVLSLIQPSFNIYDTVFITMGLVGTQVLMGNIIEPKFMGNKLNLSPLVIIIALGFWGYIWGVVGMLLSVPIMVIINIILAKFPATRPVAILLSEKGELQVDGGEEVIKTRKKIIKDIKNKFRKK